MVDGYFFIPFIEKMSYQYFPSVCLKRSSSQKLRQGREGIEKVSGIITYNKNKKADNRDDWFSCDIPTVNGWPLLVVVYSLLKVKFRRHEVLLSSSVWRKPNEQADTSANVDATLNVANRKRMGSHDLVLFFCAFLAYIQKDRHLIMRCPPYC